MPAKPKSKTPSLRTLRRRFLAKQKPVKEAPAQPLCHNERCTLLDLIDDAHASNRRLVEDSRELDEARDAFAIAKTNLEIAEADLANERATNQRLHAEMAPLFHRLTA